MTLKTRIDEVRADDRGWINVKDAMPYKQCTIAWIQPNGVLRFGYPHEMSEINGKKWKPIEWINFDE